MQNDESVQAGLKGLARSHANALSALAHSLQLTSAMMEGNRSKRSSRRRPSRSASVQRNHIVDRVVPADQTTSPPPHERDPNVTHVDGPLDCCARDENFRALQYTRSRTVSPSPSALWMHGSKGPTGPQLIIGGLGALGGPRMRRQRFAPAGPNQPERLSARSGGWRGSRSLDGSRIVDPQAGQF